MYDGNDWAGRKPGQPFFMQVQLHGGKYRGQGPNKNWQSRESRRNSARTPNPPTSMLPPYYPRDPVILQDWADYLDCCRYTDKEVGDVIARLEKEKLLDDTVIFFMTDHGISHARGKQFLYDEGTHVPFIIRGPGIAQGVVRDDLIEHIDMTATSLALAGIEIPKWMQGRNLFAKDYAPRDAVFAARDRCDETMEHIRSVRTDRFKYIRNYLNRAARTSSRAATRTSKAIVQKLRELHAAKKLDDLTEKLLFADDAAGRGTVRPRRRPARGDEPRRRPEAQGHARSAAKETRRLGRDKPDDRGRTARADGDVRLGHEGVPRRRRRRTNAELKRNIELNKTWAKEGK